jgi:O-antigen ligase/tetratricopeptide (TPR) repeat protein
MNEVFSDTVNRDALSVPAGTELRSRPYFSRDNIFDFFDSTRYLILSTLILLIPALIDMNINAGAGPETKFRFFTYGLQLALLFWIPTLIFRQHALQLNTLSLSLLLWCLYNLFRTLVDPHTGFAFELALENSAWAIFAFLIVLTCRSTEHFYRLVLVGALSQMFCLVYAIGHTFGIDLYFQYVLGKNWVWENELIGKDRSVVWSSLGNPNYYSHYGVLLLAWLIALALAARHWWSKLFFIIYAPVLLYTLVYTYTRGIWVGMLVALAALTILGFLRALLLHESYRTYLKTYTRKVVLAALGLIAVVALVYAAETVRGGGPVHAIAERIENGLKLRDTSMRARPLMWLAALRLWQEKPLLGQGLGRYASDNLEMVHVIAEETGKDIVQNITRQINTIRSDRTHNDYLQILSEEGVAGFAIYLLVLITALGRAVYFLLFSELTRLQRILLTASTIVCLMFAVHNSFDFPLYLPASSIFFGLGMGGILFFTVSPQDKVLRLPLWSRSLAALLLLSFVLFSSGLVLRHFLASHYRFRGVSHLEKAAEYNRDMQLLQYHILQGETFLRNAQRLFPDSGEILYHLGRAYYTLGQLNREYLPRSIALLQEAKNTYGIPELYKLLALAYIEDMKYSRAREAVEILRALDPVRYNIHYVLGRVDYITGNFDSAEQHFLQEIKYDPKRRKFNDEAYLYLGKIYEERGQYEAAARMYESQLDIHPGIMRTHEILADLYATHLNDLIRAKGHYQTAFDLAQQLGRNADMSRLQVRLREIQRKINLNLESE